MENKREVKKIREEKSKNKRIGIFGGSFNPIHNGHIKMAELAIKELNLDKLYIIPVGKPSHRCDKNFISGKDRLTMTRLAFEGNKKIEISDYEINLEELSYTYDTLLEIKSRNQGSEIFEIIGEDSAEYLEKWKNYEEMMKLCKFVYFKRSGHKSILEGLISIEAPLFNISSTEIRGKIENNKSLGELLPKKVIKYIEENNLYK